MVNAMVRDGARLPVVMRPADIEVHRTRNTPKCATVVLLDMSGSMRYDGLYIDVKRMGLALEGLIRREYPGDYLQFVELSSFAKARHISEIPALLPKPVTVTSPVVRLRADMSDPKITELDVPPHFTNIQHGLQMARRFLAAQDTPNRQVILITDGLPTAHFEGQHLYLLYPPDPSTEQATMREGMLAQREGITINIFLLSTWIAVSRGCAVRLPLGPDHGWTSLLHGRQRPRPIRRVGLPEPSPRRCRLVPVQVRERGLRCRCSIRVARRDPAGFEFWTDRDPPEPGGPLCHRRSLSLCRRTAEHPKSGRASGNWFLSEIRGGERNFQRAPGLTGAIQ